MKDCVQGRMCTLCTCRPECAPCACQKRTTFSFWLKGILVSLCFQIVVDSVSNFQNGWNGWSREINNREIKHDVHAKRETARWNFLFAKTRRNLIYSSSFIVCYLDISSNFSKEWHKLKNVNFHAFITRSCLLFAICRLP